VVLRTASFKDAAVVLRRAKSLLRSSRLVVAVALGAMPEGQSPLGRLDAAGDPAFAAFGIHPASLVVE